MKKNINEKIQLFIKKNIVGISIFLILLFLFLKSIPFEKNTYTLTYYSISYQKYGFLPRAVIGTLFELLGIDSLKKALLFIYFITLAFITFISYILNKIVLMFDKKISIVLAFIFLFNPASITLIYSNLEIGRLDIITCILSIISIVLVYNKKCLFLIPIISVLGVLAHENYLFWFSPLICSLLLLNYYETKSKKFLIIIFINVIALISTLLIMWQFSPPYTTSYDFYSALLNNSKIPVNQYTIADYYYSNNKTVLDFAFSRQTIIDYVIAIFGYLSTILILWKVCFKYIYDKIGKNIMLLLIISCNSASILFFIVCDYGRWYIYILNSLFALAIYLVFKYRKEISKHTDEIFNYIPIMIIYVLIFVFLYQNDEFYFLTYNKVDMIQSILLNLFK